MVVTALTSASPAFFRGFHNAQPTEGDTEANAVHNLKSATRQVAEGKCLLFILPVNFFFTCLPVPSVLSELAMLSVSLLLDDFFSAFLCAYVFGCLSLPLSSRSLSESAFDLASPSTEADSDAVWLFSAY